VKHARLYSPSQSAHLYQADSSNRSPIDLDPSKPTTDEMKAHYDTAWPGFTDAPYETVE
jgi:hypothetical protein